MYSRDLPLAKREGRIAHRRKREENAPGTRLLLRGVEGRAKAGEGRPYRQAEQAGAMVEKAVGPPRKEGRMHRRKEENGKGYGDTRIWVPV